MTTSARLSVWTDAELAAAINECKTAIRTVLSNQEYTTSDGKKFTKANLSELQDLLEYYGGEKALLTGASCPRLVHGRPRR